MLTYKCNVCKVEYKAPPYDGSFVIYNKLTFCPKCLITKRTASRTRVDKWTVEESQGKIDSLIQETEKHLHDRIVLDNICAHVDTFYSPSFLSNAFFTKLASIFDGSHKGLRQPIPADDLLDMWEQKQNYLDKMAIKKWGNNQPETMARINYDLAVLLGKYDSYLAWKREKELEAKDSKKEQDISIPKSFIPIQNNDKKDDEDIMSFVLADLFD